MIDAAEHNVQGFEHAIKAVAGAFVLHDIQQAFKDAAIAGVTEKVHLAGYSEGDPLSMVHRFTMCKATLGGA